MGLLSTHVKPQPAHPRLWPRSAQLPPPAPPYPPSLPRIGPQSRDIRLSHLRCCQRRPYPAQCTLWPSWPRKVSVSSARANSPWASGISASQLSVSGFLACPIPNLTEPFFGTKPGVPVPDLNELVTNPARPFVFDRPNQLLRADVHHLALHARKYGLLAALRIRLIWHLIVVGSRPRRSVQVAPEPEAQERSLTPARLAHVTQGGYPWCVACVAGALSSQARRAARSVKSLACIGLLSLACVIVAP
ncbi:hypothetical protein ACVWZW_001932 [Bradyrhizobium sp. F1.13.4]